MIKEDWIITLEDNKEYYVLDSLMYNNNNYIMIGEIDREKNIITNNAKLMWYDANNERVIKVTEANALAQLNKMFFERNLIEQN